MPDELDVKLRILRDLLARHDLSAVRLRGTDWVAWGTCGGSNVVLLSTETGVAELLVTRACAWVLTDVIEEDRLRAEELPAGQATHARAWMRPEETEAFVLECTGGGPVASDRPKGGERVLPPELLALRSRLTPQELERYRALGADTAAVMTEVLLAVKPEWTGWALAGAASEALWAKGIHPALVLVGDERRLPLYRHPTPSKERLGARAMLVLCARRHGLFANLTRFVAFRSLSSQEITLAQDVAQVEARVLTASRPGVSLGQLYDVLVQGYAERGHPGAEAFHHQGGTCGYLSRDAVARPGLEETLQPYGAVAWNPSLPGAKVEDTLLVTPDGLENLTVDGRWPVESVDGRARPVVLVR